MRQRDPPGWEGGAPRAAGRAARSSGSCTCLRPGSPGSRQTGARERAGGRPVRGDGGRPRAREPLTRTSTSAPEGLRRRCPRPARVLSFDHLCMAQLSAQRRDSALELLLVGRDLLEGGVVHQVTGLLHGALRELAASDVLKPVQLLLQRGQALAGHACFGRHQYPFRRCSPHHTRYAAGTPASRERRGGRSGRSSTSTLAAHGQSAAALASPAELRAIREQKAA